VRRPRRSPRFYEPSLVPMADMLTNTVGVALFILVFTVLTVGGAIIPKRLPIEKPTKATPVPFLCAFGRISALNVDDLAEQFLKPLGTNVTPSNADDWVRKFNSHKLETDAFVVTGEAQSFVFAIQAVVLMRPKAGGGEAVSTLNAPDSPFRSQLSHTNPGLNYLNFVVYPDGITAFRAARDLAAAGGFGTGLVLYGAGEPIRICVAGCGSGGGTHTIL
jgi:hypothetical protein